MNRVKLIQLIMADQNCSIGVASQILNNLTLPNFYCKQTKKDEAYNATLTFVTGDSYNVDAKQVS